MRLQKDGIANPSAMGGGDFHVAVEELVTNIRAQTGIDTRAVLDAFRRVPRHRFLKPEQQRVAYRDTALPIGHDQTISQPSMIAVMLGALQLSPSDRVLEIGGGSGYAAALLGHLAGEVFTIEIVPELAAAATALLAELGCSNVHVIRGNGRLGLPEHAPYDKILVSAGADDVPPELVRQLRTGGRMAIPVGDDLGQRLLVGEKDENGSVHWQRSIPCIFVPLVGRA